MPGFFIFQISRMQYSARHIHRALALGHAAEIHKHLNGFRAYIRGGEGH